jgi:hypothetical protein
VLLSEHVKLLDLAPPSAEWPEGFDLNLTDTVLRDLAERSAPIEIGSAHGFHEICLRSMGRYDVTASFGDFTAEQLEPIEAIVRDERVLGYV